MSNAFSTSGQAGTTLSAASLPRMRHWLVASACLAAVSVAQAEGNATLDETPTQIAMVSYNALTYDEASANTIASTVAAKPDAKLEKQAVMGQTADVGTTAAGLLMGASEANPLGILTLGVKVVAYKHIKEAPPIEQPRMWGMYGAFGWGAAANNLCVIAAIATGGGAAVLCPLLGLGAGIGNWSANRAERDRATFAAICQQAQSRNPNMVCTYTEPSS